jgi:hypothetical protein
MFKKKRMMEKNINFMQNKTFLSIFVARFNRIIVFRLKKKVENF